MFEDLHDIAQIAVRSYVGEHALDLVLKEDHEHNQAYAHEFVDYRARKPHVEDLVGKHPYHYERENAVEKRQCAAALHQPVEVIEHDGDYEYVDYVFDSELYHEAGVGGGVDTEITWVSPGRLRR